MAIGALRLTPKPPEVTMPTGAASFSARNSGRRRAPARGLPVAAPRAGARRRCASCPRIVSAPGKPPARAPPARRAFGDRPFQGRLDRRGRFIEIGAIQAEARFEPQAVARAKPDRRDRRIAQQRLAQRLGGLAGTLISNPSSPV